jgi:hypothetical protein
MADDKVNAILFKLQRSNVLSAEELSTLQSTVDILERRGIASASHHESHATPNSNHTNHHGSALDVAGILDVGQKAPR